VKPPVQAPRPAGTECSESLLIGVLKRYVSAPTAHSIIKLARQRAGSFDARLDKAQVRAMLGSIELNLRLFLEDAPRRAECCAALRALAGGAEEDEAVGPLSVAVRAEDDISRARLGARDLAVRLGFTTTGQTRVVTAVSELARNIVQYAGEGSLELEPTTSPPGLAITATDRGPGIVNLEDILAGNYKSKLGMGMGLRGIKRLAQHFEIETKAGRGTKVRAIMRVG
jgi:serine/threonine-protein kinase RsbT